MIASESSPVRFLMAGGFLGAGKTTALIRLARHYAATGLRVGIITNDQAEGLVDTLAFRHAGFATEEIPNGCFCCHFDELLKASGRLADGYTPDLILAEPVGSCTDLVNAVIAPLKEMYPHRFQVAPYVVLVDPERASTSLGDTGPLALSRKITYLYKMQQNEADLIAVNKTDTVTPEELERTMTLLRRNFPTAEFLPVSARTGAGFDALIAWLDRAAESGLHPAQVDYAQYTAAELALGWLNARVRLRAAALWDPDATLATIAEIVRAALVERETEIAHFKMRLISGANREASVHCTGSRAACDLVQVIGAAVREADLVINLRAEAEPGLLRDVVHSSLKLVSRERALGHEFLECAAFTPSPPVPPAAI